MNTWEIRETKYDSPVNFGLDRVEAETSEEALAVYRTRLAETLETSDNEIEQDLLIDLRDTDVTAYLAPPPVSQSEPRVLSGTATAVNHNGAGDGYQFMQTNSALGWKSVPAWGRDGWDMGRWPLVCVMTNDDFARPRSLVYIEGDVEVLEFATTSEREMYLNDVSEQFWRSGDADGPKDLAAFAEGALPDRYKGSPQAFAAPVPAAGHVAVEPSIARLPER